MLCGDLCQFVLAQKGSYNGWWKMRKVRSPCLWTTVVTIS